MRQGHILCRRQRGSAAVNYPLQTAYRGVGQSPIWNHHGRGVGQSPIWGYGGEAPVKAVRPPDQGTTTECRDTPFFFCELFFFRKKNPADVTPLGFCQAFLRKASDQGTTTECRDTPFFFCLLFFFRKKKSKFFGEWGVQFTHAFDGGNDQLQTFIGLDLGTAGFVTAGNESVGMADITYISG